MNIKNLNEKLSKILTEDLEDEEEFDAAKLDYFETAFEEDVNVVRINGKLYLIDATLTNSFEETDIPFLQVSGNGIENAEFAIDDLLESDVIFYKIVEV